MTTLREPSSDADAHASEPELERLRLEIADARRRREQAVANFETFLRETRAATDREPPLYAPPDDVVRATPSVSKPSLPASSAPSASPGERPRHDFAVFDEPIATGEPRRIRAPLHVRKNQILASLFGVTALVVLLYAVWPGGDPSGTAPVGARAGDAGAVSGVASAPAPTTPAPAPTTPGPIAGEARGVRIELVTVEPVWLRVHVDGERVLEREVGPDQRLRYAADREIVVRAGNAGGVRLVSADGAEEPLGRAGAAVTRTFSAEVR